MNGIKQEKYRKQLLILIGIFLTIPILTIIVVLTKTPAANNNTNIPRVTHERLFQSKNLQLSVQIPENFEIQDDPLTLTLISSTGSILVVRNGTDFSNLEDYMREFDTRRNLKVLTSAIKKIKEYDATFRTVEFPDERITQRSAYIYIKNSVYIFSTQSKNLYDTLDQIANSFEYTP